MLKSRKNKLKHTPGHAKCLTQRKTQRKKSRKTRKNTYKTKSCIEREEEGRVDSKRIMEGK